MILNKDEAISTTVKKIVDENPKSILEVGVAFGTYGVALREVLDTRFGRTHRSDWTVKIDGVLADKKSINPVNEFVYDNMYLESLIKIIQKSDRYDVIFFNNFLSLLDKRSFIALIRNCLKKVNKAIVINNVMRKKTEKDRFGIKWSLKDFQVFENDFSLVNGEDNESLVIKLYPSKSSLEKRTVSLDNDFKISLGHPNNKTKMRVAYVLESQNLTGGTKMLLEQMNWLSNKGHKVEVYFRGDVTSALPNWSNIEVDKNIVIPPTGEYSDYISQNCDVIVAGWYRQLHELSKMKLPVMYWEQGYEMFLGDFSDRYDIKGSHELLISEYTQPVLLAAVSKYISKIIFERYGRFAPVIPNGINTNHFFPKNHEFKREVLLVGNPRCEFKGFDTAVRALELAWESGARFKVKWICQEEPQINRKLPFSINIIKNPSQDKLPVLYQNADVFLFTSRYEGFGMPPLEAMASGLPVICTDCGGLDMFVKNKENALIENVDDIKSIAYDIKYLMQNEAVRMRLSKNARLTALKYSLDGSLSKLEKILENIKNQQQT